MYSHFQQAQQRSRAREHWRSVGKFCQEEEKVHRVCGAADFAEELWPPEGQAFCWHRQVMNRTHLGFDTQEVLSRHSISLWIHQEINFITKLSVSLHKSMNAPHPQKWRAFHLADVYSEQIIWNWTCIILGYRSRKIDYNWKKYRPTADGWGFLPIPIQICKACQKCKECLVCLLREVGLVIANGTPTQGLETCGKVLGCLHPITATLWIHVLGVATKLRGTLPLW